MGKHTIYGKTSDMPKSVFKELWETLKEMVCGVV